MSVNPIKEQSIFINECEQIINTIEWVKEIVHFYQEINCPHKNIRKTN